jgi:hypothetical protein
VKRGSLNSNQQLLSAGAAVSDQIYFQGGGTDKLIVYLGASQTTTQVFRDPSAWYHFVFAVDTTQATASNRLKIYLNGSQITAFDATGYPTQNSTTKINSAVAHYIGRYAASASDYVDGYITEVNFIDGQALTPAAFGETNAATGVWQPKKYAGTYGTNGFYLPFSTSAGQSVTADYLVVAGGGGGGIAGGGAGAGGVLTGSTSLSTGTSYAVTVGAGGIGTNNYTSTSGGNSVFSSFTAIGGAVGSQSAENGKNGGSGSGAGPGAGGYIGGLGTAGQGNNGGNSATSANFGVGGGGGAGAAGAVGTTSASGAGGIGILSSISGTATYYAGGGGGGGINGTSNGAGGLGGGGTGGVHGGANATAGTPNTGGGGGGGANGGGTTGGNGGSGVVIISYAGAARFSGGTITTSGGNTIHTFTSSGLLTNLFNDYSGNGNNWTPNNISMVVGTTYDSMLDVPTQWADGGNGRGNYCTGNPLIMYNGGGGAAIVPKNGNLDLIGGAGWAMVGSTIAVSTGKWYWEATFYKPGSGDGVLGIHKTNTTLFQIVGYSGDPNGYGYSAGGTKLNNSTGTAYGASYTNGDVIGVALDLDAGTLTFYKNNTSQGVAFSSLSGEFFPAFSSETAYFQANFGQRPFSYTPPTGFKALNTLNLPTPTILNGNQYFDATLWTGTGATLSVTNSGSMQPDLVWIKQRSAVRSNRLHDSVRGVSKQLFSDTTGAETSNTDELTAFNSNGFTLSTSAGVNASAGTYVGWQWKEGATQGFDIVTYTGNGAASQVVNHSLGVAPNFVIVKNRSASASWNVWGSQGFTRLGLNITNGDLGNFPITRGSSSITLPSTSDVGWNSNGNTYVAYLFSEVAGYSKFGSYTGNGSADGPFVFCGFRPRFVMVKRTDSVGSWWMLDSVRDTFNLATKLQRANEALAEETSYASIDMLSNGFKLRVSSTESNASGGTYIFAAFSESPFKNSLAR